MMHQTKNENKMNNLKCCQSKDSLSANAMSNHFEDKTNYDVCSIRKTAPSECVNNNNMIQEKGDDDGTNYQFVKRQPIDVVFNDIRFEATRWSFSQFRNESKTILHGVSGIFKSGELSVIMGPSGAGKSTLLNILAGFVTIGSTGTIKYNDIVRSNNPKFLKLSSYIPQDEEIRLGLTVTEAMTFAAHLKLGYGVSNAYKRQQVVEVLDLLGLTSCHHTMSSRLSGGQRKRLAIALELLSNPPILFLDEPTTGLDSSSCTQTVSLLKRLAKEGRTVVCTLHQPSALLFERFDKLYAVSEGKCIYNGNPRDLMPHLSNLGLNCPAYHNPADFLMEVAIGEYGTDVDTLAQAAKVLEMKDVENNKSDIIFEKPKLTMKKSAMSSYLNDVSPLPAAIVRQFLLLYRRNLLESKRGYMYLLNRLLAHVLIGFIFGYLYKGVGNNANTVLGNYVYLYGTLLLLVYTGKMSVTLSFPLEMKVLTREHFNRWYKLSPYLLSVILVEIPFQVLCCWVYLLISYYLTDQPIDFRAYLFVLFTTSSTLCAQSWGYFIGAIASMKIAVFIGPVILCLFSIFGFCLTYVNTPFYFKWMYFISYFRAGFHGIVYSMYGVRRNQLPCPEEVEYCHYSNPEKFLEEMDIVNVDLVSSLSVIVAIWCAMNAATYLSLWYKLTKR